MCSDRDHAGVPGSSFWGREDQNVPGRPLAAAVRLHQDISTTHSWAPSVTCSIICGVDPRVDVCCSLPRPTSTLGPCSFRCVWAGTCTCPLSSCWWSPLSTLSRVHDRAKPRQYSVFWVRCTHISTVTSGGLAAVIYTDTLQTLVMIIGAIILTITGLFLGHLRKKKKKAAFVFGFYTLKVLFPVHSLQQDWWIWEPGAGVQRGSAQ